MSLFESASAFANMVVDHWHPFATTTSATMVPGAPGYWDWVHGICPRCRSSLAGWVSQSEWNGPNLRHQLTFPLTPCWLCRVQTGGWATVVFEA